MADTRNTIARQKSVRQEALRQQLSAKGHVQHVIEMAEKLSDEDREIDRDLVSRYKIAIDTKLRLMNKYLPDLKAVEVSGGVSVTDMTDEQLNAELAREYSDSAT